jgi:hypothetical protein
MAWRLAASLDTLRTQINTAWPDRNKASDGTIGDTAHQARTSDHNPDPAGVVRAFDVTHDPTAGADMHAISEALRLSRDPRIKYVIWNSRMYSSYATSTVDPWTWRSYSGSNLHTRHMHMSVVADDRADNTDPWSITIEGADPMAHKHTPMPDQLPNAWADGDWEQWVVDSGTRSDSRGWTFYREDLGWVWTRVVRPIKTVADNAFAGVKSLQTQVTGLAGRVSKLESAATGPLTEERVREIAAAEIARRILNN